MGEDDIATLLARKGDRAVVLPMVAAFGGHIIDTAGDGILAETASAVADVECTWWFQEPMAARSERVTEARRMRLRLGINLDEVYCGEQRTDGDGINIATRLENLTL